MKVSIITATFNSEHTIQSCMDSVLGQTYTNIEYIVVDGNSSDKTLDYIREQASAHKQIKYVSEPDMGIYDALNKGIERSTGDIIGFVHSDDHLANSLVIEHIVNEFKKEAIDGVYGNLHYVRFDDTSKVIRNWISQPFKMNLLNRGWMPAHPTLFLRDYVYRDFGNFNLDFRIAADYDFVLRIFSQSNLKFVYIPETITVMRTGGESNRNLRNLLLKSKEDLRALKNNKRPMPMVTLSLKNLSKIPQWLKK